MPHLWVVRGEEEGCHTFGLLEESRRGECRRASSSALAVRLCGDHLRTNLCQACGEVISPQASTGQGSLLLHTMYVEVTTRNVRFSDTFAKSPCTRVKVLYF